MITSADNEDNIFVSEGPIYFLMLLGSIQGSHLIVQNFYEFALLVRQLLMMVDLGENFFIFYSRKCLNLHILLVFQSMLFQFIMLKHFIFGKMIATCVVQGGEPPTCFASAVELQVQLILMTSQTLK